MSPAADPTHPTSYGRPRWTRNAMDLERRESHRRPGARRVKRETWMGFALELRTAAGSTAPIKRVSRGESPRQDLHQEVYEETGLRVEITEVVKANSWVDTADNYTCLRRFCIRPLSLNQHKWVFDAHLLVNLQIDITEAVSRIRRSTQHTSRRQ